MNTPIYTLDLWFPVTVGRFVGLLQEKCRGRDFGVIGYTPRGFEAHFLEIEYCPSLDDYTGSFISEIVFAPLRCPRCLSHILSAIRVAFRGTGSDELLIHLDKDGDLVVWREN